MGASAEAALGTEAAGGDAVDKPRPNRRTGRKRRKRTNASKRNAHALHQRVVLISVAHATRDPDAFYASHGQRRVYLPTDRVFGLEGDRITEEGARRLGALARLLREHPNRRVSLEVHSDGRGRRGQQLALSKRRAAAAKRWLLTQGGVSSSQLRARGLGSTRPIVPPDGDEQAQASNRRIEVRLRE